MISKEQKETIITLYKCGMYYYNEIAIKVGVSSATVGKVVRNYENEKNKNWLAKGGFEDAKQDY